MKHKLIIFILILIVISLTQVSRADLVAYWAFDDGPGSSIANDSSGNEYHGTLQGSPTWVTGRIGGALQFDGVNDYVSTGQSLLNNLSEFTLACWVRADVYTNKVGFVGQNDCIEFGFNANDLRCWNLNVDDKVTIAWPHGTGSWHHVAVAGNSSGMTLYIDGRYSAGPSEIPGGNYGSSPDTVKIGGEIWDPLGGFFDGILDEVRIYDHALSQAEIEELYTEPTLFSPAPVDGDDHIDPCAIMSWSVAGAADPTFEISIGTDSNCNDVLVDHSTGSDMHYTPSPGLLGYVATYYWRVDVHNDGSEYIGDVWSFTTGGKATDPMPESGQTNVEPAGNVSWAGDDTIASHNVYFAEISGSLELVGNYADTTVSMEALAASIGLDILDSNTTYKWRVDTYESEGSLIATGDLWTFTVKEYSCQDLIQLGIKKPADMNNDCQVNMLDLAILAQQWTLSYEPN